MKRSRLLLLVGLLALWPSRASAQDWWGWLEELSGPGPFHGGGASARLFCMLDQGKATAMECLTDRDADPKNPIRQVVELRAAWLTSGDHPRFTDAPADTRTVHALRVDALYQFRIHPTLDAGAGAGFIRFSGDGVASLHPLTVTPLSVSFLPFAFAQPGDSGLRRWTRVVRLRFEETYVTKGFTGADFGNLTTTYSKGGEFLASVGVRVDLAALIRRN